MRCTLITPSIGESPLGEAAGTSDLGKHVHWLRLGYQLHREPEAPESRYLFLQITHGERVVEDPDGNKVALAETSDPTMAQ